MKTITTFFMMLIVWTNISLADTLTDMARTEMEKAVKDLALKISTDTRLGIGTLKGDSSRSEITDFLMTALTRSGFTVLDNRSLKEIFKQQGLETGDYFNSESVKALGEIEGVDAIVYGDIKSFNETAGKYKINVHLQCTYIGKGGTPWAYDLIAGKTSENRQNLPYIIGGVLLFVILLFIAGVRRSGRTKIIR